MYGRLLVPMLADDDGWWAAAKHAIELAAATGATVHGVYVIELKPSYTQAGHSGLPFDDEIVAAERRGEEELWKFGELAKERGVAFDSDVKRGVLHREILGHAAAIDADAIVVSRPVRHRWLRRLAPDPFDRVVADSSVTVIDVK